MGSVLLAGTKNQNRNSGSVPPCWHLTVPPRWHLILSRYLSHCATAAFACVLGLFIGGIDLQPRGAFALDIYAPPMAVLSFLAAIVAALTMPTWLALWVWVPNALLVLGGTYVPSGQPWWSSVLAHTFGSINCAEGDCTTEILIGAPTQFSARFRPLREREGQGNETSGLLPTPGSRSRARACTYRRLFPLPVSDNDAMKALQRSFA